MKLPKLRDYNHEDVIGLTVTGIAILFVCFKIAITEGLRLIRNEKLANWVEITLTLDRLCALFVRKEASHGRQRIP